MKSLLSVLSVLLLSGESEFARGLTVAWDANPETNIIKYSVWWGTESGNHQSVQETSLTTAEIGGLDQGITYFFVVTATNAANLTSDKSVEISYTIPLQPLFVSLSRDGWKTLRVDSEETNGYPSSFAYDGNPDTFWHTQWRTAGPPFPHELHLDLGQSRRISGMRYLPRQDAWTSGNITSWELFVSEDWSDYGPPVASGTWSGDKTVKTAAFVPKSGRYVWFAMLAGTDNCANIAELDLMESIEVVKRTIQYSADMKTWIDVQVVIGPAPKGEFLRFKIERQ